MIKPIVTIIRVTKPIENFERCLVTPELLLLLIELQVQSLDIIFKLKDHIDQTTLP